MSRLRHDLGEIMGRLVNERGTAFRERVAHSGRRARSATEDKIRERPFMSIFFMMIFGMLLGRLLSQRSRS